MRNGWWWRTLSRRNDCKRAALGYREVRGRNGAVYSDTLHRKTFLWKGFPPMHYVVSTVAAMAAATALVASPATAQPSETDLAAFLVGEWNAKKNCASADMTTYRADGSFITRQGRARYIITGGDGITMIIGGNRIEGKLTIIDQNTIRILVGREGHMGYRCLGLGKPA